MGNCSFAKWPTTLVAGPSRALRLSQSRRQGSAVLALTNNLPAVATATAWRLWLRSLMLRTANALSPNGMVRRQFTQSRKRFVAPLSAGLHSTMLTASACCFIPSVGRIDRG